MLTTEGQRSVVRSSILFFFLASLLGAHQLERPDPAFDKIPFDKWLSEGRGTHFHWGAKVPRVHLSFHQRFATSVDVQLDGRDLQNRRREGELVFFAQITDRGGIRYRDHYAVDLAKFSDNIKAANIEYSLRVFVLPGDYHVAVVLLDTATDEHSTIQTNFRVPSPPGNLLASAWRGLPPIEFLGVQESPDSWYLPEIEGKLQWAPSAHASPRLNVLMNVGSSSLTVDGRKAPSAGFPALLPTLKVLTQTGAAVPEKIELVDLSRKRVVYQHQESGELDWPALKASLQKADTASIDVGSLANQHQDAQFFVSSVRTLLRESKNGCLVVILATPGVFPKGEDLTPISLEALPPCQVFYVRYNPFVYLNRPSGPFSRRGSVLPSGDMGPEPDYGFHPQIFDQLAATLKPLNPRLYDVANAMDITRVLEDLQLSLTR